MQRGAVVTYNTDPLLTRRIDEIDEAAVDRDIELSRMMTKNDIDIVNLLGGQFDSLAKWVGLSLALNVLALIFIAVLATR
jgi:hypothetical protein